ncbi:MAG: hypothetical protein ACRD2A_18135, partial [Vicinamibacterales bacterium]
HEQEHDHREDGPGSNRTSGGRLAPCRSVLGRDSLNQFMRATTVLVLLLSLLAGTLACVNEPLRPSAIQLGKSLNSDNSVGTHTTTFKRTDTIYVSVLTMGRGAGTIAARWTYAGQVMGEPRKEVSYRGDAATEFHLANSGGFPAGEYQVDVLVDGKPFGTRRFRVEK